MRVIQRFTAADMQQPGLGEVGSVVEYCFRGISLKISLKTLVTLRNQYQFSSSRPSDGAYPSVAFFHFSQQIRNLSFNTIFPQPASPFG
jgi:hypothetical protein